MKFENIVILAGGNSTRFWPLSHKNLLSFQGKALIQRQLEFYGSYTNNCVIVTNKDTFDDVKSVVSDDVQVIVQEGEGQAAAILSAKDKVHGEALIVNGNDMYDQSMLDTLVAKKENENFDGLLAAVKTETYVPGGYLQLDNDIVTGVIEKPPEDSLPSPYWKFFVDYFKNFESFISILESAESDNDDVYEVALTNYISQGKKFSFIEYGDSWATLKYPWHVLDAKRYMLSSISSHISDTAQVSDKAVIQGNVFIDDGAKVHEFAKIVGPAYIGKNVVIGNYSLVIESMIEEGTVVGGYSEITRSYVGKKVWTHRSYIGDSIIEGPANFGAGSVTANLRFDKSHVHSYVKGDKTNTNKEKLGLIAGRNVELGVNSATMPGLKIAPGKLVMPGSVAIRDIT